MPAALRWVFGIALAAAVVGGPTLHYRARYEHDKRLRVVTPGRVFRCGQLTHAGFDDAIRQYGIRTVLNLQNEFPDPLLQGDLPDPLVATRAQMGKRAQVRESELCARLGVRLAFIDMDLLDPLKVPAERPRAIGEFLQFMDDPDVYPVLIHCKAGLHRTGELVAVYRMEYEGWSARAAAREMRANGFGDAACTTWNNYLIQYVQTYRPRREAR